MPLYDELMVDLEKMMDYRKSAGYSVEPYPSTLKPFIKFLAEKYPTSSKITQNVVDEWLKHHPFSKDTSQAAFISRLRQFTRFLHAIGKECFIPDEDYTVRCQRYNPYLFNDTELTRLFNSIDTYKSHIRNYRTELIIPVLFRMMYCCGMRPAEPLHLRTEDVNLTTGDIYIRQTKLKKDRHILMSKDMLKLCKAYDSLMGKHEWFFHSTKGEPISTDWMRCQFHKCWELSGLVKRGNPRPYDLRHVFATRTMTRWIDSGKDIMVLLPYLSAYMGHANINNTLYYIHLLPDKLRTSSGVNWGMFDEVYGEVGNDVEN